MARERPAVILNTHRIFGAEFQRALGEQGVS